MSGYQGLTIGAERTMGDTRRWTTRSWTTPSWAVALGWAVVTAAFVGGAVLGSTGLALWVAGAAAILARVALVAVRFSLSDRAAEQALLARRGAAAVAARRR